MIIATLQFELIIRHSACLKDKRRVVNSVKERLQRKFRVAVAEVGALDHQRLALLGLAAVSNSPRHGSQIIDRVLNDLRNEREAELGEVARHIITGTPTVADQREGEPSLDPEDEAELLQRGLDIAAAFGQPDAEDPS
ncbi:MAG: DUF503 domain-containing protein [Phycisphaerales bacterium]|nr:DUF503 domain-containing protein [Phycisphaerales bacterium]